MLITITGHVVPGIPHRYIALILAGLRPGSEPLPGSPPAPEKLREIATIRAPHIKTAGGFP
ncbi:MAG: hypothetical protein ABSA93_14475 [Streptosporangiaceae bacterium]|jgi:hypothetical protein